MSIDTAADRKSAAGVPFLPLGPNVTPDALAQKAWRQQAAWGYSGIPATLGIVTVSGISLGDGTSGLDGDVIGGDDIGDDILYGEYTV